MKTKKILSRFFSILLICTILATSTVVFAAESTPEDFNVASVSSTDEMEFQFEVDTNGNILSTLSAEAGSTTTVGYLYPNNSGWALWKTLNINTNSPYTSQGAVYVYVYNPSGELISNDLILGYTETYKFTVWNATAGTYTVRFVPQGITGITYIAAWF